MCQVKPISSMFAVSVDETEQYRNITENKSVLMWPVLLDRPIDEEISHES